MGNPFDKKQGGTATATKPAAAKAGLPGPDDVANVGEETSLGKGDPFAASDPTGISGYKPAFFLGQLILMHPTEHGSMSTSVSKKDEEQEFIRADIIPLTLPEAGTPNANTTVATDEGYAFLNRDGEVETCEPYEVGERLDDVMIFNKALVREGKKALDKGTAWLLGRIVKGNKKPNQSAPYILAAGSDEDKALYQEWRKSISS